MYSLRKYVFFEVTQALQSRCTEALTGLTKRCMRTGLQSEVISARCKYICHTGSLQ